MSLDYKVASDNEKGAAGTQRLRAFAVNVAERMIPLADGSNDVDPEKNEWISGRIGDVAYVDVMTPDVLKTREEQAAIARFLERREFAVMYARSCALAGADEPLAVHQNEFDLYLNGAQSFDELRYAVVGWSLGEYPWSDPTAP